MIRNFEASTISFGLPDKTGHNFRLLHFSVRGEMKKLIGGLIVLLAVATAFYAGNKFSSGGPDPEKPVSTYAVPKVPEQLLESGRAFSEIVKAVGPAVVNISTVKVFNQQPRERSPFFSDPFFRDFFGSPFREYREPRSYKEQSMGSGVIVSPDGLIVTNNHVVKDADEIKVTLFNRKEYLAEIVGTDPKTDLAVIKIEEKELPTVPWGNSEKLEVGEFVLAIGSPFGLARTVTMGIISATGRANVGIADYEDFIQTDAAINPGNSGGPLVNIGGELVGINTAIFSRSGGYQGIGFAVPSNMAKRVMKQLLKEGRVSRGWFGVTIQDITPEIADHFGLAEVRGALVGDVMPGSPAEKAGIRRGDVVLEFDGKVVDDVSSFRNIVASTTAGSKVSVVLLRNGKKKTVDAKITELPIEGHGKLSPRKSKRDLQKDSRLGLSVIGLSRDVQRQLGLPPEEKGVVVVRVDPGSPADEAGLRKGDVIQEVNRQRTLSVRDFDNAVSAGRGGGPLLMFVNRLGRKFYVSVAE